MTESPLNLRKPFIELCQFLLPSGEHSEAKFMGPMYMHWSVHACCTCTRYLSVVLAITG